MKAKRYIEVTIFRFQLQWMLSTARTEKKRRDNLADVGLDAVSLKRQIRR